LRLDAVINHPPDLGAIERALVSTIIFMPQTRKIFQVLSWVIAGLCAIVLILAVAIQVDRHVLRRKAERLLADLKSLEMRKSTYQDAQLVIAHWKDSIHQEGPCQPSRCDVQIALGDLFTRHHVFLANHQRLAYVFGHVCRFLGARPAMIDGFVRVRKNIVWGKGVNAVVTSHFGRDQNGGWFLFSLIGQAQSGSPEPISSLHPEYRIGRPGGCTFCKKAYVIFTPYANPADVRRLMDINFSCLTSWHPCETQADILPTAWNEYTAEKESADNSVPQKCSPDVIRVLSRESKRVVIGEVTKLAGTNAYICSSQPPCAAVPSTEDGEVTVLLQRDFKPWTPLFPENRIFYDSLPLKEKLGDKYVFFFKHTVYEYLVDQHRGCNLLPATKENIEAVRRGVAEDWADHDDESQSPPGK